MEKHVSEIVAGRTSAQSGLDALALDLQHILGGRARLRHPAKATK